MKGLSSLSPSSQFWLFGLLVLLPFLVMDIGWFTLRQQTLGWENRDQEEKARQLLESMEKNWPLRKQVKLAGYRLRQGFLRSLQVPLRGTQQDPDQEFSAAALETTLQNALGQPFPKYTCWVFGTTASETDSPFELLVPRTTGQFGRAGPASLFRFLHRTHFALPMPDADRKRGRILIEKFFGKGIPPTLIGKLKRGQPLPVVFERVSSFLIWDAMEVPGRPTLGYILLVPVTVSSQKKAFQLACGPTGNEGERCKGFVWLTPSEVPDILPRPLHRSQVFQKWLSEWRPKQTVFALERNSSFWHEPVGNRVFYSRLIPDCTHLAIVGLPQLTLGSPPWTILAANGLLLLLIIILLTQAAGLSMFHSVKLRHRFLLLFLLGAVFPLSLALSIGTAFISDREETLIFQRQNQVLLELKTVDQAKNTSRNQFLSCFQEGIQNQEFLDTLKKGGLKSPDLFEGFSRPFRKADLPVLSIHLFNYMGDVASLSFPDKNISEDLSFLYRFYQALLVSILRDQIRRQNLPDLLTKPYQDFEEDQRLMKTHQQLSQMEPLITFFEMRGALDYHISGELRLTKIHDFLTIDGVLRYAIFVVWNAQSLDDRIIRQEEPKFPGKFPGGVFQAFRRDENRLSPILSVTHPIYQELIRMARPAEFRSGPVTQRSTSGDWLLIAFPGKDLEGVILTAAVPLTGILQEVDDIRFQLFLLLGISITLVLVLGRVTGDHVIAPITRVQEGVEAILQGNLHVRVGLPRPDELGQLTESFDTMITHLEERQRLSTLVSENVLDAFSSQIDLTLATQARKTQAVLLVSDIRDFTTLSGKYQPEEITALLNQHFSSMSQAIAKHGGRIDKFIGDAIHAVFEDLPDQPPQAAANSLHAAWEMLNRLTQITQERQTRGLFPYRMGMGISCGEVVFAGLGDPEVFFDFTIIGKPLKEAERLEALSKQVPLCPIVISEEVAKNAGTAAEGMIPLSSAEPGARVFPNES